MNLELVQFENTDKIILPGLLYSASPKTDKILIALHGKGSAAGFYNVTLRNLFGRQMTEKGIDYLTFTNTGGHQIQKFDQIINGVKERKLVGVAFELIKNCLQDIDGAVNFARGRGYKQIYLIGHSTGANKICVYNYYKPENPINKYILESGGDDSGLYYATVGEKKFNQFINKAREMINLNKGETLVPGSWKAGYLSYQSLLDQIEPDGDYNTFPFNWELNKIKIMSKQPWREIKSIDKPCLVIYGDKDEYCYGRNGECLNLIKKAVRGNNNFSFKMIKDADHGYTNKEDLLIQEVVNFL